MRLEKAETSASLNCQKADLLATVEFKALEEYSAQDHQLCLMETHLICGPTSLSHYSLKDIFHSMFMAQLFLDLYHVAEQYMVEGYHRRGTTSELSESNIVLLTMGNTS